MTAPWQLMASTSSCHFLYGFSSAVSASIADARRQPATSCAMLPCSRRTAKPVSSSLRAISTRSNHAQRSS